MGEFREILEVVDYIAAMSSILDHEGLRMEWHINGNIVFVTTFNEAGRAYTTHFYKNTVTPLDISDKLDKIRKVLSEH